MKPFIIFMIVTLSSFPPDIFSQGDNPDADAAREHVGESVEPPSGIGDRVEDAVSDAGEAAGDSVSDAKDAIPPDIGSDPPPDVNFDNNQFDDEQDDGEDDPPLQGNGKQW